MKVQTLRLAILGGALGMGCALFAQTQFAPDTSVSAVRGESWIKHLHRPFDQTSMGKTWDLGPPPDEPGATPTSWHMELKNGYMAQSLILDGSDLYRLNCRGCHGESGQGSPPEINAVVGPVQASSVAATIERMKETGGGMSKSEAVEMAKESKAALLQRLHMGGVHMPPPTLNEMEIRSLVLYLEQLSGVPGSQKSRIAVKESSYRAGEHIVKSVCHVCHSAVGPNPTPDEIYDGAIPPLSVLPSRVSLPEFVRKVTAGAPIIMGNPPEAYRGRMPVFSYLTEDEAAAAYFYLVLYPPQP